jgi:hypothetical protein
MMKVNRLAIWLVVLAVSIAVALTIWGLDYWYREEENYTEIEPGLYLGGFVLEPPPGCKAVISLYELGDPFEAEVHIREPIRDSAPAPSLAWLRRMVEAIDQQRSAGRTTFVHCSHGVSRSAMLVAAFLMYKHRWSRDQALEFLHSKRPQTRPNPAFMQLLLDWERELQVRNDDRPR